MTRLTDGKNIIEISMYERDSEKYGPMNPDYAAMDNDGWLPLYEEGFWLGVDDLEYDDKLQAYKADELRSYMLSLGLWQEKRGQFRREKPGYDRLVELHMITGAGCDELNELYCIGKRIPA